MTKSNLMLESEAKTEKEGENRLNNIRIKLSKLKRFKRGAKVFK